MTTAVYLTFDMEVWCSGWDNLDAKFPASYSRYVLGRSRHGDYALPKTLELLNRYGLRAIFFVEPLFAARFGLEYLARIVDMLRSAGQEIQLHLHPEWTDEISPPLLPGPQRKRQHLIYYSLEEQCRLIATGKAMLEQCGSGEIHAFRSGSFACSHDTYRALAHCGIANDSSLNQCYGHSGHGMPGTTHFSGPGVCEGVSVLPMTVFRDGFGRMRPAQVGACSFQELRQAMEGAYAAGNGHFVLLSHNFEMLKPNSLEPERIVEKRFTQLCQFLAANRARFPMGSLAERLPFADSPAADAAMLHTGLLPTLRRYVEQLGRRF